MSLPWSAELNIRMVGCGTDSASRIRSATVKPSIVRHVHVEEREVEWLLPSRRLENQPQRLVAARRQHRVYRPVAQGLFQDLPVRRVVVDDQHAQPASISAVGNAHRHRLARTGRNGKLTENRLPRPSSLSTQTVRPSARPACAEIVSPRPVPP